MATFLSELRSIAEYCNFGDTLETMLRDRLVCGINDDRIQQKLLSEEKGLTLKSAIGPWHRQWKQQPRTLWS